MAAQESQMHHEKGEAAQTLRSLHATQAELEDAVQYKETLSAVQQAYNELHNLHTNQYELLVRTQREMEALGASLRETEQELLHARDQVTELLTLQSKDHQELEELQQLNHNLQQELGRLTNFLETRDAEISNVRKELDQLNLEREDLAQGLRDKHTALLQVQQELLETHQSRTQHEELTAERTAEKDLELEAVKQERDSLIAENQALLEAAQKGELVRQEQIVQIHKLIEEREQLLNDLNKEIDSLQAREAQANSEADLAIQEREGKIKDLQGQLTESQVTFSKTFDENTLQFEEKLRYVILL